LLIQVPESNEIFEVRSATERLLDEARIEPATLLALSSRQFEELIAEIWSRLGYKVELTLRTRDGGRDVVAVKKAEAEVRYLIECKHYDPQNKVGVQFVRALYGVRNDEKATKAFLATTSKFTRDALVFFDRHRWELEPRDFEGVTRWISLARTRQFREKSSRWVPGT
jgi:restriction endonuclease Mrr